MDELIVFSPFYNEEDSCSGMWLKNQILYIENKYADNMILADSLSDGHNKFKFYARIANLNNEETKIKEETLITEKIDSAIYCNNRKSIRVHHTITLQ